MMTYPHKGVDSPILCVTVNAIPVEFLSEFSGFSRKRIRSSSVTLYSTDSQSPGGRYSLTIILHVKLLKKDFQLDI